MYESQPYHWGGVCTSRTHVFHSSGPWCLRQDRVGRLRPWGGAHQWGSLALIVMGQPSCHPCRDRRRRTWQSQICAGVMVILSVVGKSWSWSMKLRHRYRLTSECSLCSGNEKRSKNRRTMGRVSERSHSTILVFPRKEQVHQLIVYQGLTKIPKSKASWFIVDVNIQMVFLSWLE